MKLKDVYALSREAHGEASLLRDIPCQPYSMPQPAQSEAVESRTSVDSQVRRRNVGFTIDMSLNEWR